MDTRSGFPIWNPDLDSRSGFQIRIPDLDSRSEIWIPDLSPGRDRDPIIEWEEFEEALASSRYAGGCGGGAAPPPGPTGPIGPGGRKPTKKAKVPKGLRRPKAD